MTLIEALQTIPDPRRGAGRRYPLWVFLLLIILATMSGYRGYRGLTRFMLRHQGHLADHLGLRRGALPSYSTVRRLLMEIDFNAVADAFNLWAQGSGLVPVGSHCAVDGKSLKNTVTQAQQSQQNFVNAVSVFQKADALQARIRAHWGIKNPLHWVKDVGLGEDHASIAARPAATLMALIRNLVITLFRRAGHASITAAIDRFSNDLDQLLPMVNFPSG
jgi:predicted transposase YbfD/YdcC